MKIGILGTGDVGKALANGFLGLGHEVKMGAREANNEKAAAWVASAGAKASGGTFADAARFGELVCLATLGVAAESALGMAGADNLKGKVLIDATNPLDFSQGMPPRLANERDDSLGERVQRAFPGTHVVKAFNTVGNALFVSPKLPGGPPSMFIAGNDEGAKKTVGSVCRDFGWDVVDCGGIEASRWLEAMCMLWVGYGFKHNVWGHAFKLLRP